MVDGMTAGEILVIMEGGDGITATMDIEGMVADDLLITGDIGDDEADPRQHPARPVPQAQAPPIPNHQLDLSQTTMI